MSRFFSIHFTIAGLKNLLREYRGPRCIGVRYVEVLFHTFYYCWPEEFASLIPRSSLYRGSLCRGSFPYILLLLA